MKETPKIAVELAAQFVKSQDSVQLIEALKVGKPLKPGCLKHLDASIGDLAKLETAIETFKNVPGAMGKDGPITKLLECGIKQESLKTACGAAYELEKAFDLVKSGEKIIAFGVKEELLHKVTKIVIKALEIDIETTTKLIECKNWDWSKVSQITIDKLQQKLPLRRDLANSKGKLFELHFKNKIPSNLEKFKNWLTKNGIIVCEG